MATDFLANENSYELTFRSLLTGLFLTGKKQVLGYEFGDLNTGGF